MFVIGEGVAEGSFGAARTASVGEGEAGGDEFRKAFKG